ncbi:MAG: DinB family protein [Pyrinomonadaceae bacterium]|nr:DinB family protein [Pyrinomonadaceae bacterium]
MSKFTIDRSVKILRRTPSTLKAMLSGLSGEWTIENDSEDQWSAFDVVGHLIHGEETDWIPRAKIILSRVENPVFEPFDRFAQMELSKGKRIDELLDRFAQLRLLNLDKLTSLKLTEAELDLKGMHPELGEVDLRQLIATWVVHDLNHISQIARILSGKYADEVGPWKAYLSVLK